jgi:hypothetical protein
MRDRCVTKGRAHELFASYLIDGKEPQTGSFISRVPKWLFSLPAMFLPERIRSLRAEVWFLAAF